MTPSCHGGDPSSTLGRVAITIRKKVVQMTKRKRQLKNVADMYL